MIMSGKQALISPASNGRIPGVQTPLTAKKKKKSTKEGKKGIVTVATSASASALALTSALNHSRKLSDNRLCLIGSSSAGSPDRIYQERHKSNNSPNNHSLSHKEGQYSEIKQSSLQHQDQKYFQNERNYEKQDKDQSQQNEGNQDIKNKLLNLLTSKNESKKLLSSKSSGNSLDFASCELGKRKKSPPNGDSNYNSNIQQPGGIAYQQLQYHISKKSPSINSKNLLYFQEKPVGYNNNINKTQQIHSGSSTHYAMSPKEPKSIQTILQQAHERSQREKHLYTFSPHLRTILKSKGLSPEKRESISPNQDPLKNIIPQKKNIINDQGIGNNRNPVTSSGTQNKQVVSAVLKKKPSTAKAQVGYLLNGGNLISITQSNGENQQFFSKQDNSKERIINLLNSKQDTQNAPSLKEYNTRKSSAIIKKPKSVSPEGQQSASTKAILNRTVKKTSPQTRPLTNQQHQAQTKKAFFKKLRPPELEEVPSGNTISQSVPNSSKNNPSYHPPFHTPSHIENGQRNQKQQQKKQFYFDSGSASSNSQLLHSHTVNTTSPQNGNTFNLHHSSSNPNNQSASMVNHSNSARSSNQPISSNPIYQNYLYQFLHGAQSLSSNKNDINNQILSPSNNSHANITTVLNNSLKNAENRLMKIQEDMQEGETNRGNQQFSDHLQKTFLRTSKLLTGYKTRELKWEQEKRVLVDEIKFLKNLLYTEQFDDIVINS